MLLLFLLAILAGAETFTDIARFGERKIELLRRFRPYVNGTPSHDHLGDIFAMLDADAFTKPSMLTRPYRDPDLHRDTRCRLAAGAPPMAPA